MPSRGPYILALIIIATFSILVVLLHVFVIEKKRIGKHSIRESINHLPVALAVFDRNGLVKLSSNAMNEYFREYTKVDLQNHEQLIAAIETLEPQTLKSISDVRVYLLPNGVYFMYQENKITINEIDKYTECIFFDVTELHKQEMELQEQSSEIMKRRESLQELSDNLLELGKEREILTAKTNIHNQMGSALISARQALTSDDEKLIDEALANLDKIVTSLGSGEVKPDMDIEIDDLMHDASSLGVSISIDGTIPDERDVKSFILLAIRTALTNAVQHGHATSLDVKVYSLDDRYVINITNNGETPTEDIVPRGGLKNLIRQGDRRGYKVSISSKPRLELQLIIKK